MAGLVAGFIIYSHISLADNELYSVICFLNHLTLFLLNSVCQNRYVILLLMIIL